MSPVRVNGGLAQTCGRCSGRGFGLDADGKRVQCRNCNGAGRTFQRITMEGLPGRNRREKRLNAKLAQKAYLADRRAS